MLTLRKQKKLEFNYIIFNNKKNKFKVLKGVFSGKCMNLFATIRQFKGEKTDLSS